MLKRLQKEFQGWSPEIHDLFHATKAEVVQRQPLFDRQPLTKGWTEGCTTLLGDSEPSTKAMDDFVDFCRQHTQFAPFTEAEKCGIRLMDVLRNKKAPINACDGLMKWHLVEQGIISNKEGVGEAGPDHFIGRCTALKAAESF